MRRCCADYDCSPSSFADSSRHISSNSVQQRYMQSVRNGNWDSQQLQQHMDSTDAMPCSYSSLWARIKTLLARTVSALPQVASPLVLPPNSLMTNAGAGVGIV